VARVHLEPDAGGDEGARVRVSKSEPPCHVTYGVARRLTTADGAKNLAHDPLNAR
jgi:hypothetical protein